MERKVCSWNMKNLVSGEKLFETDSGDRSEICL